MEKYITWYRMMLKIWLRKKSSPVLVAVMLLATALVAGIRLPDAANVKVGLYNADGQFAARIANRLLASDSVFTFESYADEEALQDAVTGGEIECGFIFEEGMEEKLNRAGGKSRDLIAYVATPLTTKGSVAKETVYAAFLEEYSEMILLREEETVFGEKNPEVSSLLLEKNAGFLEGDQIFDLHFAYVKTREAAGTEGKDAANMQAETGKEGTQTFPVRGIAALFVFIAVFLEHGRRFSPQAAAFEGALAKKEAVRFRFVRYLSAASVPAAALLLGIVLTGNGQGILRECFGMLALVFLSALWMVVAGAAFQKELSYSAWTMTLILAQFLLCPVFVDLTQYIPAIRYIRLLFPAGVYLELYVV